MGLVDALAPTERRALLGIESRNVAWRTPEGASGNCYDATALVIECCPEARFWTFEAPVGLDFEPEYNGHHAAVLRGWVVDLTARQFWPEAEHPLVERLGDYLKRFETGTFDREEDALLRSELYNA